MYRHWTKGLGGNAAPNSQFNLLSTASQGATGSLTVPSIGDTDYNRLSLDNEGIWHPVLAEELRQKGQRRIENLLSFSEDMTETPYSEGSGATIDSATQATFDGTANARVRVFNAANGLTLVSGESIIFTVSLRLISGTISANNAVRLLILSSSGAFSSTQSSEVGSSIGSESVRVVVTGTADASGDIDIAVECDDAATLEITDWQLEDSTGRDDVTTPSSYVSTGVGTGSELVTNGENFTDTVGWSESRDASTLSAEGGNLRVTADSTATCGGAYEVSGLKIGATYRYDFSVSMGTAIGASVFVRYDSSKFFSNTSGQVTTTVDIDSQIIFVATATTMFIGAVMASHGAGEYFEFLLAGLKQIDHGANVDGVIYSPYENGNVVNSNVVTEARGTAIAITPPQYVELSGNLGGYVSTPDSAATSITGDIDFILYMSMDDWTPSSAQVPIAKWSGTGNLSYAVQIAAGGTINLFLSSDGSATVAGGSTATGFADGTAHWLRVTWSDSDDVVNFYTSDNDKDTEPTGDEWTQLGAADVPLVSAGIFDGNAPVTLSGITNGGSQILSGSIYQAQIYNGIDGTLAAEFNAADGNWQTPKSFTSSTTDETYTIHGDAFLATDETQVNYFTPLGFMAQGEATEISGYSNDIANWPTVTSAAVARDAVGLTGQPNSAETLTDSSAVDNEYRQRNFTVIDDSLTTIGVIWTPYAASPAHYPMFSVGLASGTGLQESIVFDPSDGNYVERIADGDVISVRRIGDMWRIEISVTNNSSGNVTGYTLAYPAWNTTLSSSSDVATEGSTVIASFEVYKTISSFQPLLTTGGTTKTVSADVGQTLELENFSDPQGSMEFVLTPEFLTGASASEGVVAVSANAALFLRWNANSSSQLNINDGTTNTNLSSAWSTAGQSITIKFRWGNGTMRASVDGVLSSSVAYDGSFSPSGAITLFKSLTLGAEMKDLKIWFTDLGNDWL